MKDIVNNSLKLLFTVFGFAFSLVSCEYQEVVDAGYPDQKLYLPTAVNGIYMINDVPQRIDFLPTPGQAYRFTIDQIKNKMIVPFSVYRSGLTHSGRVTAGITVNNDTIATLLAYSKLPATSMILPAGKYTLPASVDVADGSEFGSFNLEIDLVYLRDFPDAIFTLGITIASVDAVVNPLLKSTVLVINTKILKPKADFTFKTDATNGKKIAFTNTSAYGMTYSWNFGDGTTVSSEKSPTHEYAAAGKYDVTLTTSGVTGDVDKVTKTSSINVQ